MIITGKTISNLAFKNNEKHASEKKLADKVDILEENVNNVHEEQKKKKNDEIKERKT